MLLKIYEENNDYRMGITVKKHAENEQNNMALHACQDASKVLQNRQKLAAYLNVNADDLVCAHQTHSANLHKVSLADKGRGAFKKEDAIQNTDALYTYEPDIVLCSFTADCVPVIFYHKSKGLIGVIHSGWQGTVSEITSHVFRYLQQTEQCNPSDFHVQLGMALSQQKFEVDKDVYDKFKALGYAEKFMYFNEQTGKYHIDNQLTVKKQCELAGIPSDQIRIDRTCTFQSPEGFSYRQDRQCGRHLSFIMKRGNGKNASSHT